jgi:hypothetical protein
VDALFLANSPLRRTILLASARFYLYKNQMLAFPRDHIRFGIARRQPVIASDNDEAFAPQVTMGQVLTTAAGGQVRIPAPPPRGVPKPVEKGSHHLAEIVARATQNLSYLEEA